MRVKPCPGDRVANPSQCPLRPHGRRRDDGRPNHRIAGNACTKVWRAKRRVCLHARSSCARSASRHAARSLFVHTVPRICALRFSSEFVGNFMSRGLQEIHLARTLLFCCKRKITRMRQNLPLGMTLLNLSAGARVSMSERRYINPLDALLEPLRVEGCLNFLENRRKK